MRQYPTGFKRYERVHPTEVINFIREEIAAGNAHALGELVDLTIGNLTRQTTYLITRDGVRAGFACVKFENNFRDCWMTYLYVSPSNRGTGCAKYAVKGLKVNRCSVPVGNEEVYALLNRLGFVEASVQRYPNHQIEMENPNAVIARDQRAG